MASAEKQREKGRLVRFFIYSRNQWKEQRRGAQCLNLFIGRRTLWQIKPSQTERKRQEGGRAEGGLAGAARPPSQFVILSGRLHRVSAGLFACWVINCL